MLSRDAQLCVCFFALDRLGVTNALAHRIGRRDVKVLLAMVRLRTRVSCKMSKLLARV